MLPAPVAACLYNLFFQPQPAGSQYFYVNLPARFPEQITSYESEEQ